MRYIDHFSGKTAHADQEEQGTDRTNEEQLFAKVMDGDKDGVEDPAGHLETALQTDQYHQPDPGAGHAPRR